MLLFDPEEHVYKLDGRHVPSVTQVLSELEDYSHIPRHILDRKARLGTAVHKAVEMWLADDLEEDTLHPEVAAYFNQFKAWFGVSGFKPILIEERVYSTRFRYAGTLDLYGEMQGKRWLIDTKTAYEIQPTFGPQTAAYEAGLLECKGLKTDNRGILQLSKDKYKFIPMTGAADLNVFYAALTIKQWRIKYGKSAA